MSLMIKIFLKRGLILLTGILLFMGFFVACGTFSPLSQKPQNQVSCAAGHACDEVVPPAAEKTPKNLPPSSRNISSVEKSTPDPSPLKISTPPRRKAPLSPSVKTGSSFKNPFPVSPTLQGKNPAPNGTKPQAPRLPSLPVYSAYPKTSVICEGSPVRTLYFSTSKDLTNFRCHFQKQKLKVQSLQGLIQVHAPFRLGGRPPGFKGEIVCLASSSSKSIKTNPHTKTQLTEQTRSLSSSDPQTQPLFEYTYKWEVAGRGKACFYQ